MDRASHRSVGASLFLIPFLMTGWVESASHWVRAVGGASVDSARDVCQAPDGGFVVVGSQADRASQSRKAWCFKLDPSGSMQWQRTFSVSGKELNVRSIELHPSGGYLVGGNRLDASGRGAGWCVKLSPSGRKVWDRVYEHPARMTLEAIRPTSDGGLVAGGSIGAGFWDSEIWCSKLDALGRPVWQKTYGSLDYSLFAVDVRGCSDGGFVLAGQAGCGILCLRLDAVGHVVWAKTYRDAYCSGSVAGVAELAAGGFLLAGDYTTPLGARAVWVMKVMSSGAPDWQTGLGGEHTDRLMAFQATSDGGCVLTGDTITADSESGMWCVKLDSARNLAWQKKLGGRKYDLGHAVRELRDGGYVFAGQTHSFGSGKFDALLVRMSPAGELDHACRFLSVNTTASLQTSAYTATDLSVSETAGSITLSTGVRALASQARSVDPCHPAQ